MSRLDRLAIRRLDWLTGYKKAGLAGTELISTTFALGVQCSVNTTTASDYDRCDCNENTMCADLVWACDLNFTLILQLIHTWFWTHREWNVFSSDQAGTYTFGKAHIRSASSLRSSFPKVAFETVKCWSDWRWPFPVHFRRIVDCFLFLCLSPPGDRWCGDIGFVPASGASSSSTYEWNVTMNQLRTRIRSKTFFRSRTHIKHISSKTDQPRDAFRICFWTFFCYRTMLKCTLVLLRMAWDSWRSTYREWGEMKL